MSLAFAKRKGTNAVVVADQLLKRLKLVAGRLGPGDVAWAGVGCVHSFRNVTEGGTGRVRWLETQAPQPPGRHSYRFRRDWTYLENALAQADLGQPPPNGQGARHG